MKEELIALGKVLQSDFEDLVNQQVTGWLTNDFLMNADLQPLTELEAELSAFWDINDQFAFLEAWLTSGFIPGEWGMGSGEWGMGSGEWGIGSGEWGVGTGMFTQQGISPATVNSTQQFEVQNQTQGEWRSPSQLPELTSVSQSSTSITNYEKVTNQTSNEWRSPSQFPELTNVSQSSTSIPNHEEVKNQTLAERRSPLGLRELAAVLDSSTSITNEEEVQNRTHGERRSPLGLKELANFLASESYTDDSDTVNSQATAGIHTPRQPDTATSSLNSEIQTASKPVFSSQDSDYWEGIEVQNRVGRSNFIPKSIIEADDSSFESGGVVSYPTSHQTVQNPEPWTSQPISKGSLLSESSFSQEQHQDNYSQENPTTKQETNFFPHSPLPTPHSPIQDIEIDLIFEAIAQEINREYRRFYGC